MALKYSILLFHFTLTMSLSDDSSYGTRREVHIVTAPRVLNANNEILDPEIYYKWRGGIRSSVLGSQRCLAVNWEDRYRGSPVTVDDCPADDQKLIETGRENFIWNLKGKVVLGADIQPIFEGYIRSEVREKTIDGQEGSSLCLTSFKDPQDSRKFATNRHTDAFNKWWDYQDLSEDLRRVWKKYETSFGPAFLSRCNPKHPAQMWQIGLNAKGQSRPRGDPADPANWTWIRPKLYGPGECTQPDSWPCADKTCPPNYQYRRGLMSPYSKNTGAAEPQVGCSPTLWYFHPNFIVMNDDGLSVSDQVIVQEQRAIGWAAPFYQDLDFSEFQKKKRRRRRDAPIVRKEENSQIAHLG